MDSINIDSLEQLNQRLKMRIDLVNYSKIINYKIPSGVHNLYFVLYDLIMKNTNKSINYSVLEKFTGYQPKTLQRIFLKMEGLNLASRIFDTQNKILSIEIYDASVLILNYYTGIPQLNNPEYTLKIEEETCESSEDLDKEQANE